MTNVVDAFVVDLSGFLFKGTPYTPPTDWYVGLGTSTVVSTSGVVSAHYELTGGVYARQLLVLGDPDSNGLVTNSSDVNWAPATIDHGTVGGAILCTAASGSDTIIGWQALTTPVAYGTGTRLVIPAGSLRLSY